MMPSQRAHFYFAFLAGRAGAFQPSVSLCLGTAFSLARFSSFACFPAFPLFPLPCACLRFEHGRHLHSRLKATNEWAQFSRSCPRIFDTLRGLVFVAALLQLQLAGLPPTLACSTPLGIKQQVDPITS